MHRGLWCHCHLKANLKSNHSRSFLFVYIQSVGTALQMGLYKIEKEAERENPVYFFIMGIIFKLNIYNIKSKIKGE